MIDSAVFGPHLNEHWPFWFVTVTLIVAAVIDGYQLKVPNWITFPMVFSGWALSALSFGWEGFLWSLVGTFVGLALLLPAYLVGGMGAGDVKLLAGVGAWVGGTTTFYAFCVTAVVGGVIAIVMVLAQRAWKKHYQQFWTIYNELTTIRDTDKLSEIAAERKKSMMLLPYGIPIAIGTIAYFAYTGDLL